MFLCLVERSVWLYALYDVLFCRNSMRGLDMLNFFKLSIVHIQSIIPFDVCSPPFVAFSVFCVTFGLCFHTASLLCAVAPEKIRK
jgi:hypothetical protein